LRPGSNFVVGGVEGTVPKEAKLMANPEAGTRNNVESEESAAGAMMAEAKVDDEGATVVAEIVGGVMVVANWCCGFGGFSALVTGVSSDAEANERFLLGDTALSLLRLGCSSL
jgi:hypothetical protein